MKVENMVSERSGKKDANQFIITDNEGRQYFQSYDTIIAVRGLNGGIELDGQKWDYSVTTGKYRNIFLGETTKETQAKIDSGVYKLVDLN